MKKMERRAHPSGPHFRAPKGEPPNPEKLGAEGWGPKFRAFASPATISLFSCLSGCLFVEFWWCLEFSGCCVKPWRPNVHILGSRPSKTPSKFNEKTPRETEKERNGGGRGEKKREILGGPAGGRGGGLNNHNNHNHNNNQEQQPQQPQPQPNLEEVGPKGGAPKGRSSSPPGFW